ncbi:MAG TPA: 4-carboxy-4-hydroxy-2-oxoadipate aldolase/oxaloacetate decarboxylase [Streptosporangiaceae bacterium]
MGVTNEQITRLSHLDTCAVSDALDALALPGAALGLHALTIPTRLTARVLTVDLRATDAPPTPHHPATPTTETATPGEAITAPPPPTPRHPATPATEAAAPGEAIATPPPPTPRHLGTAAVEAAAPGEVIVVSAGGRTDAAGWGGVLALAAVTRGVAGVVIDGACRDVDEARDLGLPVYARAGVPRTARGRLREVAWNEPVEMAGVAVRPGDAVIADGSGVVFVPAAHAAAVLLRAERIAATEAAMAARVRAGEPVSRVMSGDYENMLRTEGTDHG